MIENCRSCLHLFNNHWICEVFGTIVIAETNPSGKGEAVFESAAPCIMINPDPKVPTLWALARRSCADGAFLSFLDGEVQLHIVELKSKITLGTWAKVIEQFEGMFLTALAVVRLMEIHELARVTCYLAGTVDAITDAPEGASLILSKAPVGKWRRAGKMPSVLQTLVPCHDAMPALVSGPHVPCNESEMAGTGPAMTPKWTRTN